MTQEIFKRLKQLNKEMDNSAPNWLQDELIPDFKVNTFGEDGPNLVLLHGLFGAMTNWDDTIPYFKEFAKTHAFHFPLLTGTRAEVKIKSLALYTELFINQNKLKPLVVCGNSLGGHVALRLALNSPDLVDGLVLAGSSGLYEHTVDTLPIRPGADFIKSQMERVFYDKNFITDEAINEVVDILKNKRHQLNIIHAARSAKKDYLLKRLKEINIPVLLIWGKEDRVTSMDVAETFHENLPNSELVVFDNCGHAPMIEQPENFSNAVNSFLKEQNLL